MRSTQLSFAKQSDEFQNYWKVSGRKFHGGYRAIGKRKTRRPLDTKKPIHTILKSKMAKGRLSFRSPLIKNKVDQIIHKYAERFGIKIHDYSNNGDHLHLSHGIESRLGFQRYLKAVRGLIA